MSTDRQLDVAGLLRFHQFVGGPALHLEVGVGLGPHPQATRLSFLPHRSYYTALERKARKRQICTGHGRRYANDGIFIGWLVFIVLFLPDSSISHPSWSFRCYRSMNFSSLLPTLWRRSQGLCRSRCILGDQTARHAQCNDVPFYLALRFGDRRGRRSRLVGD